MNKTILAVLSSALILAGLTGCSNRNDEIEAQLMQHDAQLRRMQPVQADNYNEVQSLREEVRELRGLIMDLKKIGGSAVLVDKLNRHEAALHQIETSMAMQFDLGTPIGEPVPAAPADPEVAAAAAAVGSVPAAEAPAAPAAPAEPAPLYTYGGLVAAPAAAAAQPAGNTWGQETPRPKQQTAEKDIKKALYQAGVNAFSARQYDDALRSFNDYLTNFGSSDDEATVASAHYYLGECYFQTNEFSNAALAYDKVITQFPNSPKAPGAYLKQGISFSKMNQKQAARDRMRELIKKYPSSAEAARARDYLKNNK